MAVFLFFFNDTATTEIYTLSLHDALPIYPAPFGRRVERDRAAAALAAQLPRAAGRARAAEYLLEQLRASLDPTAVRAHAVEALERQLARDLRVVGDARLVGHLRREELVLEPLGICEAERVLAAHGRRALDGEPLLPERERRVARHAPEHAVHHAGAGTAARGVAILEERDVRPGLPVLVRERHVEEARIALVT